MQFLMRIQHLLLCPFFVEQVSKSAWSQSMFVTWKSGDHGPPFLNLWLRFRSQPSLTLDLVGSESHDNVVYNKDDLLLCLV